MPEYYLGLMSGTSVDGIDAAIVKFDGELPQLVYAHTYDWPPALRQQILDIISRPGRVTLLELGSTDAELGERFAAAALQAIEAAGLKREAIRAIGCHGQTLYHAPDATPGFSIQSGDGNRIAQRTGITTITDFRRRDIASGGQGAPLVPAFHKSVFSRQGVYRAILNIGGMANLTLLPGTRQAITGFDTGPGNALMDSWCAEHKGTPFDRDGAWAESGKLHEPLLQSMLRHPYFDKPPPKSTGRETFNREWLDGVLVELGQQPERADVQRTLCELTALSISRALDAHAPQSEHLLVCGGGIHNRFLLNRLTALLAPRRVTSTGDYGIEPDWVEAVAFAWLARETLAGRPGNVPQVTGAREEVILGAIHPGAGWRC